MAIVSFINELNKFKKYAGPALFEILSESDQPALFEKETHQYGSFIDSIADNLKPIFRKIGIFLIQDQFSEFHPGECQGFFECRPCIDKFMNMFNKRKIFNSYKKAYNGCTKPITVSITNSFIGELNKFNKKAASTLFELLPESEQLLDLENVFDRYAWFTRLLTKNLEPIFKKLGLGRIRDKFYKYHRYGCTGFFKCGHCLTLFIELFDLDEIFNRYKKICTNHTKQN